jgi:tRNA(Ile)-lysidine synthase TilS/MesJ
MRCSKCGKEAVIFQQYSGRYLCREHLAADIESRIKRDIRTGRWMRPGDHLAIVLSGSKRSRALLLFFHNLTARRRDVRLSAIVIHECPAGCHGPLRTGELADRLGIPCHTGSLGDESPLTSDESAKDSSSGAPCSGCRQLHHEITGKIAQRAGITRIISDRTVEDQATEILENIFLGQVENLLGGNNGDDPVPWIDPLGSIPRAEADLYADLLCPGENEPLCPDRGNDFSDEVRDLMEEYTKRHPATPYSIAGIGKVLGGDRICRRETEVRSHAA